MSLNEILMDGGIVMDDYLVSCESCAYCSIEKNRLYCMMHYDVINDIYEMCLDFDDNI